MHDDVPSFTEILSLWDDDAELVADLGLQPSARSRVRRWRERNSVPPPYWQRIIDMAEHRHGWVLTPRHLMLAACGQHRPFVKQQKADCDTEALIRALPMVVSERRRPKSGRKMPMSEEILVTRQGAVLEIRMNRPAKKNALTKAMYGAMADALEAGDRDAEVRAILISAEGDMFTAGNDISDFAAIAQGAPPAGDGPLVNRFLSALAALEKPLVAAVNGNGVGVGATMLLHCDIVIIAEEAQLSMPFTGLGLTPEAASSLLLPAQIGHKRAFMMLALGQPLVARDAVRLGIASEAAPREEVRPRALTAAEACCDRPPEAMRITKRLLRDKEQIRARLDIETEYFRDRLRSPEAKAAFEAFFKR